MFHVRLLADIRSINTQAVRAKKTGMIILGGGLVKHHISNANLMVTQSHFVLLHLLAPEGKLDLICNYKLVKLNIFPINTII